MSAKEIKILFYTFIILSTSSCKDNKEKTNIYLKDNFKHYSSTHKIISDSINLYLDSSLATFKSEYVYGWYLDSLVCINSSNDKLFALIIQPPTPGKGFFMDDAMQLLGKKINNKWYFFKGGGTLAIPRSMYGYSETNPPSQYFLSQIARKNMMESALEKKGGEYVIDDDWVENKFYNTGYGLNLSRAQYDSIHWALIMRKWKEKIDTNEYKPFKKFQKEKPNS